MSGLQNDGQWQDEVVLQKTRLQSDLPARLIAATMAFVLAALFLGPAVSALLLLIYLLSEVVQVLLLRGPGPNLDGWRYVCFLANSLMGVTAYAAVVILLWQHPEPMVKLTALFYLSGGLLNTAVTHSQHLPLGLVNATPLSLALLVLPVQVIVQSGPTPGAMFALAGAALLLGYFYWAIIDHHRLETEIARARRATEDASRAKSRFLAEMSHEIRTPMNAILGVTRLMQEPKPGRGEDMVALLENSAMALQMVIDDALAIAENAVMDQVPKPLTAPLVRGLRLIVERYRTKAADRDIRLVLSIDAAVPEMAIFDPLLVRHCLGGVVAQILIDAPAGEVTISAGLSGDPTGPGMAVAFAHARGLALSGDGCNLVVARRIAAALGGRIDVPEPGSADQRVRVYLPIQLQGPGAAAAVPRRALRVLVVDDIATNRFIVTQLLKRDDIAAAEADSGKSALEVLSRETFDVVLLDMNMPQMSGAAVFDAIRTSGQGWAGTPVIALTADALAEQRLAYLDMGLSGYVAKPVDRAVLLAEIDRVLRVQ